MAKELGKPIDGHAPGVRGADAKKYIDAGITTDHECFTYEEALEKINYGMKILIREGSAAKNFEALIGLLSQFPDRIMFCSDDKHPDELVESHINALVKRAIQKKYDLYDVLRASSVNPIEHYNLPVGLLREGDKGKILLGSDFKNENIFEQLMEVSKVCSLGQLTNALFQVGGQYRRNM